VSCGKAVIRKMLRGKGWVTEGQRFPGVGKEKKGIRRGKRAIFLQASFRQNTKGERGRGPYSQNWGIKKEGGEWRGEKWREKVGTFYKPESLQ